MRQSIRRAVWSQIAVNISKSGRQIRFPATRGAHCHIVLGRSQRQFTQISYNSSVRADLVRQQQFDSPLKQKGRGMARHRWWIGLSLVTLLALAGAIGLAWRSLSQRQPWVHVAGRCGPQVEGAVFGRPSDDCGGDATTFDSTLVYSPFVLRDVASPQAPCPGLPNGSTCYRMWYSGSDGSRRQIGYAVSADGIAWSRVRGELDDGSVLGPGGGTRIDRYGVSVPVVLKDSGIFKMWYTGWGENNTVLGIGYATSTDGRTWTRMDGPLSGGAVLLPSGVDGAFDRDIVPTAFVLKDLASTRSPCPGIEAGNPCYRMWFEGVNLNPAYHYDVGYATSPDGLHWTRIPGPQPTGGLLGTGWRRTYDEYSAGWPFVVKDGALYRMWYQSLNRPGNFSIGHAVSPDGLAWERTSPLAPVWTGADDPGTFDPDDVTSVAVMKDGPSYWMWYSVSSTELNHRIGLATMTPGQALKEATLTRSGERYSVSFHSTQTVPAGGSVLIVVPGGLTATRIESDGFGSATAWQWDPGAITDAAANNQVRSALLLRLTQPLPPGVKTVHFTLDGELPESSALSVQLFGANEVVEYGDLPSAPR